MRINGFIARTSDEQGTHTQWLWNGQCNTYMCIVCTIWSRIGRVCAGARDSQDFWKILANIFLEDNFFMLPPPPPLLLLLLLPTPLARIVFSPFVDVDARANSFLLLFVFVVFLVLQSFVFFSSLLILFSFGFFSAKVVIRFHFNDAAHI